MLRILFLAITLFYNLQAADNNTLLNKQLEAINRQLTSSEAESGKIDPTDDNTYNYNQNTQYLQENPKSERFYVGASGFIGYFITKSDMEAYDVKESTSFAYLRAGYIFKTNNRIELSFIQEAGLSYTTFEDEISGINLNMIIPIALNKEKTAYLKLLGGIGLYDYSNFSLEGFSLNPGIGTIYDITNDIELDLTYQYQVILWKDFGHLSSTSEISTTTLRGLNVGVKYKF